MTRWATRRRAAACLALALLALLAACAPRFAQPGPRTAAPSLGETFVAADGTVLPYRVWRPARAVPRAVIVAVHGYNDYSNAFADSARRWREAGITTYAYDQRGFGKTRPRGLWAGYRPMVDDLVAFTALVRARHPGTPLFLLGSSMGGAVVLVALADPRLGPVAGAILAAPAVWGWSTMPVPYTVSLWLAAHTVPWLTLSGRGLERVPSDNTAMLRRLGRDPLVIKESRVDTLYGLVTLMDAALDAAARARGPILVLYGEHDQIVPPGPILRMLARLKIRPDSPRSPRRVAIYEKGYHMLLRDLEAETVRDDIAAWIFDPTAPLPSRADRRGVTRLEARK